jgi:ribosomal small subunit protein bTHX
MGRGDKKSKKGKIAKDSYGNSRNKKQLKAKLKRNFSKKTTAAPVEEAAAKPKRTVTKKKADA